MNKKGIVLLISLTVIVIISVLIAVYFSSILTEKRSADTEQSVLQALELSEAGSDHGYAELRERVRTDLKARVANIRQASVFQNLVAAGTNGSLSLIRDYAYAAGDSQFVVSEGKARLTVPPLTLNTGVPGTYGAEIIIEPNGAPTNPSGEIFIFPYKYNIESQGTVTRTIPNIQRDIRLTQGTFTLTIRRDTFSKFALFTSHHRTPSGITVWFTADTNFTGPVSTNERFSFANNPSAHFTEEVTQHQKNARFYNNGWPILLDADYNGTKDVPSFDEGFERSYDIISLESSITQTDLKNQALGGTSEPGSNGIYVPNDGSNLLGAIYIRGNQGSHTDDAIISLSVDEGNNPIYVITQGSNTTTVSVNYSTNQTTVQQGSTVNTYNGIPDGMDNEGILIYVNDDIKSLSGTIAATSQVTVSSERDIVITGDVLYQEYNPATETISLNADGYTNLLGILSWGGDVRIGTSAPDDIDIHAVVMAPHGVFTVDNYNIGSPRGTATLLGGAITDFYGPFGTFWGQTQVSGYGRNFVYDARMLHGMAPPYFPYLSTFTSFDDGGLDKKLIWEDQGA